MREGNNNAFRDEQLRVVRILREKMMLKDVVPEQWVRGLKIDGKPYPDAKLDIVIGKTIGIRLQGPPHEKKIQKRKDGLQRMALETLGWKIIDFWYDRMPNLWARVRTEEIDALAILEVTENMNK